MCFPAEYLRVYATNDQSVNRMLLKKKWSIPSKTVTKSIMTRHIRCLRGPAKGWTNLIILHFYWMVMSGHFTAEETVGLFLIAEELWNLRNSVTAIRIQTWVVVQSQSPV